ncbi:MAG: hypothetical protein SFW62_09115 [Alphaproteobacteria bacterium]|nr:hypothetical protein [Alphaproteobacteria bacterium]
MSNLIWGYMMEEVGHVAAIYEEMSRRTNPNFTWTQEQTADDVCHNGKGYIRISCAQDVEVLQRGAWYRDGSYKDPVYGLRMGYEHPHSVHGLFINPETANAAGQVLLEYRLPTVNNQDLSSLGIEVAGRPVVDLRLPPKFGASMLLTYNEIPVSPDRETALARLQERFQPTKAIPA